MNEDNEAPVSRSDTFQHGYAAGGSGAHISANPHEVGSACYAEWKDGFTQFITDKKERHDAR